MDDTPTINLSRPRQPDDMPLYFGVIFGVLLVVGVVGVVGLFLMKKYKQRAHHYARTARTARHPSPSAPRQELAEVENDYTRPPPTNPRFVQVNEV